MRTSAAFLLGIFLTACPCAAQEKSRKDFANVGDLHADVAVLNVLHVLHPTPAQVKALRRVAATTMQKPPPRKLVKVSEKLRKTMTALREALASGDEKIEPLFQQFDELRDKENPEFDDVEISDEARKLAPSFVRSLSSRQVATYVASVADFPDPIEQLVGAMSEGRKLRGRNWQALRDDVAYQVGWLVGGLDVQAEEKARERATELLNKAHKLNQKSYLAQEAALENEARTILGKLGPTDVLRNFMERVAAETLSSHRLVAALDLWEKAAARKN